jgi:hypothetical protein
MRAAQRLVLRTEQTPLRALWSRVYEAAAYGVAASLAHADDTVAVYLKGGLGFDEPVFGLSDVDMIAVVAADANPRKDRLRRAWKRLCTAVPFLSNLVYLFTYDSEELTAASSSSCLTFSLTSSAEKAAYLGKRPLADEMGLLERPGLFGPTHDWRRVRGLDRRPPEHTHDRQEQRIAAWLELQLWTRYLYAACADPTPAQIPYMCVKLVVEPARVWLWIAHGRKLSRRSEVLEQALRLIPEEEDALRATMDLRASLPQSPDPPLAEVLPVFFRLCSRVANKLGEETEEAGSTMVDLLWGTAAELVLEHRCADALRTLVGPDPPLELLPIVDWRALVVPSFPDETLALIPGDPCVPSYLGAAALAGQAGTYPLLRFDGLTVLPATTTPKLTGAADPQLRSATWSRVKLRGIQCRTTDPVTHALVNGMRKASFPNVPGWCARDVARRAVAEHRAWLELEPKRTPPPVRGWIEPQEPSTAPTGGSLFRLLTAARAALFLESLEQGNPRLPLTMSAVAEEIAEKIPQAGTIAEEARDNYRAYRRQEASVDRRAVEALRSVVGALYAP